MAVAVTQLSVQQWRPRMLDDSFQYLTAATSIRNHGSFATSLIHFETERAHGVIPAPVTWFPPGYSLAISILPLSEETAASVISILGYVVMAGCIWRVMGLLKLSIWTKRAATLCWIANSTAITHGVSALSESLFSLFGLSSVMLLIRATEERRKAQSILIWTGAALLAGASYWIRYAGVFFIAIFVVTCLATLALRRQKGIAPAGGSTLWPAFGAACVPIPLMTRNFQLIGDWKGGNNTPISREIQEILFGTPQIIHHLMLGDASLPRLGPLVLLIGGSLAGLALLAFFCRQKRSSLSDFLSVPERGWGLLVLTLVIYLAGVGGIALRAPIAWETRMISPALPFLICAVTGCTAYLVNSLPARSFARSFGLMLAGMALLGYCAANLISHKTASIDSYRRSEALLAEPEQRTKQPLVEFLKQELQKNEVIASANGQATGYILDHPTLSLVGPPYTLRPWDEQMLRSQVLRFQARHLLLFRTEPIVTETAFLRSLVEGNTPKWLKLVASTANARVYSVDLSAQD
jgi:hypothetical protein